MTLSEVKRQLQEFYSANGVGIRRTGKMVKSDLNRVRRNMPPQVLTELREYSVGAARPRFVQLDFLFVWGASPEGHEYWEARDWGRVAPEVLHA